MLCPISKNVKQNFVRSQIFGGRHPISKKMWNGVEKATKIREDSCPTPVETLVRPLIMAIDMFVDGQSAISRILGGFGKEI